MTSEWPLSKFVLQYGIVPLWLLVKLNVTLLNHNGLISKLYVLHDNIIYVIVLIKAYVTA